MSKDNLNFEIQKLGKCKIPSPMKSSHFTNDDEHVIYETNFKTLKEHIDKGETPPMFEKAGPREKIFFDSSKIKCGIVTCGGLCPGINDVIRAIVYSLHYHYKVRTIYGFKYGYEGLTYKFQHNPIELTIDMVADLHEKGGTLLKSSRGPQEPEEMVDILEQMNVNILFGVGGDGTLRGLSDIADEVKKRNLKISVIGIPKTIDNDISYIHKSFGFESAVSEAKKSIYGAHVEASGAKNGIGLVKLMGRHSGYIAANASLASSDVNYCLIPEVKFSLEKLLSTLKSRLEQRSHAVIVVGEGAGQDLMKSQMEKDASGNLKFSDIGLFLNEKITEYFTNLNIEVNIKYIDPSYIIRSIPANPNDSVLCLLLGHNAVHAGMTGRTNMAVATWNGGFTYLPIPLATSKRKKIDPDGFLWSSVVSSTGQPDLRP